MLDNEQSWSRYLKHETQARYGARRPPGSQFVLLTPNTQMNSGALDGRGHSRQNRRKEWQRSLKSKRVGRLFGRKECEGDFWRVTLLTPKARPKAGVNDSFNRFSVRHCR